MPESRSLATFSAGHKHKRPDFAIFERHQPTLRRLYLKEDKALKDVKFEMEKYFGFPKTP